MTYEEAIKHFKSLQKRYTKEHNGRMCEKVALAIEALEKQIPKKPVFLMDNPNYSPFDDSPEKFCGCPACHDRLMKNYPCKCGQLIDWSDT